VIQHQKKGKQRSTMVRAVSVQQNCLLGLRAVLQHDTSGSTSGSSIPAPTIGIGQCDFIQILGKPILMDSKMNLNHEKSWSVALRIQLAPPVEAEELGFLDAMIKIFG
jgi:hypothetical protein